LLTTRCVCCFNLAMMSRSTIVRLALVASAGVASATLGSSSSYVQDRCHELLAGVENEGHSHFEVAALCRARFPSNLCREGLKRLGRQPWSPEIMRSACISWDAEWQAHAVGSAPARRTQDLVESIDYTMDKKQELGICKAMSFEECLKFKMTTYPQILNNVTRVVGQISADASAQGQPSSPSVDTPTAPATVDDAPTTPAAEVPGTTKPIVGEWAVFHRKLDASGQQSHLPWAVAGFTAGIVAGALLVLRATSGLRRTHDIISAVDAQ